MAYRSARKPRAWHCRQATTPFTPQEDEELCNMVRCGLDCAFYRSGLPDRPLGQVLERRLQLVEAGAVQRARPI